MIRTLFALGMSLLLCLAATSNSLSQSHGSDMKGVAEFVAEAQAIAERQGGRVDITELAQATFKIGADIAPYEAELRKHGFNGGWQDTRLQGKFLGMSLEGYWGFGWYRFIYPGHREIRISLFTDDGKTLSRARAYIFTHTL